MLFHRFNQQYQTTEANIVAAQIVALPVIKFVTTNIFLLFLQTGKTIFVKNNKVLYQFLIKMVFC